MKIKMRSLLNLTEQAPSPPAMSPAAPVAAPALPPPAGMSAGTPEQQPPTTPETPPETSPEPEIHRNMILPVILEHLKIKRIRLKLMLRRFSWIK